MDSVTLALDVMGGDNGPRIAVPAIKRALHVYRDLNLLIFGEEKIVLPLLRDFGLASNEQIKFIASEDYKGFNNPISVLRHGKNTSLFKAIESVGNSKAQGAISAGSTGALVLVANHLIGTLPNVHRSALVQIMPSFNSKGTVLLDLGANLRYTKEMLYQYGVMGSVLAKCVLGYNSPKLGLLNIGTEDSKGPVLLKECADLFKANKNLNYIGFIEGNDIFTGNADVIVTDAFTGNVALKTAEGLYRVLESRLNSKSYFSFLFKPIKGFIKKRIGLMQPDAYNGSILLGLDGVIIKSHGSANSNAYFSAISQGYNEVRFDITKKIAEGLTQI